MEKFKGFSECSSHTRPPYTRHFLHEDMILKIELIDQSGQVGILEQLSGK
jgi:hypothetical protein